MKCPYCGKTINLAKAARELASKGGKKSRRTLSPEDAKRMVEAREKKQRRADGI